MGSKSTNAVLGAYTYLEFGLTVLGYLPIMALSSLRHRGDPTQRIPGRWMRRLGRTAGTLTPLWKLKVEGERPSDIDHRGYVVVSNHESTLDPFLLSFLPWDMRWVAKEELFKPPVVGWAMRWGGDIPLRRGAGDSIRQMLDECERAIRGGISVMMFPEGTRSRTGDLLPFKDGAFKLAIKTGAPILPIAITGTRAMMPKGARWFGETKACAKILPPISTEGMTDDDLKTLREQARNAIRDALPDLRERYGDPTPAPDTRAPAPESV